MLTTRISSALALCAALLVGASSTAHADKLKIERLDATKSPYLQFYMTYIDGEGRVITQKAKEDFKLTVDSTETGAGSVLTTFGDLGEGANVIAIVQITSAMSDVLDEAKRGTRELATVVGAKSKFGIYAYGSDTKRVFELGSATEGESAANNITLDAEASEPHLLDAVRAAIETLSSPTMKDQRKLIVLFSDGIDINMERKAFSAIGKKAQEAGVIIDTIGFAPFEVAKLKNLEELSKQSNGTHRIAKAAAEVTTTYGMVNDELKKQYVVTYQVSCDTVAGDNKEHVFQVLQDPGGGKSPSYSNTFNVKVPKCNVVPKDNPAPPEDPAKPKSRWWLWVLIGVAAFVLLAGIAAVAMRDKGEPEPAPAPVAAPAPSAAPQKQRTMALNVSDLGGGKQPAVGWIVGMTGANADKTFKLKAGRNVIGTGDDCDIKLADQGVSGHHCEIRTEAGAYKLLDLGSTNGVVVNDKKVREHELVDNDVFRVGKAEFKFKTIS